MNGIKMENWENEIGERVERFMSWNSTVERNQLNIQQSGNKLFMAVI